MGSSVLKPFFLYMLVVTTLCFQEAKSVSLLPESAKKNAAAGNQPSPVQVAVKASTTIGTIADDFLCATLDWWPKSKCNYGTCPWHSASILNLDLGNPILSRALTELAPLKVRLGGSLQDGVVYEIGSPIEPCLPFTYNNSDGRFGFKGGCLPMQRWDALNQLFKKTGSSVAFGLNILYGRNPERGWDDSNAADFMRYTKSQGYPVTAWELGNEVLELGKGDLPHDLISEDVLAAIVRQTVSPELYAADVKKLRALVDTVYHDDSKKPLVVAPDSFYNPDGQAYNRFLTASGKNVVDVVTRHIYNLGPGVTPTSELVARIRDPVYPSREEDIYASLQTTLAGSFPWASAWIGESGGAFNSGHGNVTDAFIMAFWYLDQLGMASKHNVQAFCRQTLIGGHYGLLDAVTYVPNPDFYGALLWQKLMGNRVLSAEVTNSQGIRAYAHCQKGSTQGAVTLLLLNYNNVTSHTIDVSLGGGITSLIVKRPLAQPATSQRLEYHMAPAGGDVHSRVVLLNGSPLNLGASGELPKLDPILKDSSLPISLNPLTYAYVVFPDASADACR